MMSFTHLRTGVALAALVLGFLMAGCDHKVVESTRTTEGPNGTRVEKKVVTENDNGTVTEKKETHTVDEH